MSLTSPAKLCQLLALSSCGEWGWENCYEYCTVSLHIESCQTVCASVLLEANLSKTTLSSVIVDRKFERENVNALVPMETTMNRTLHRTLVWAAMKAFQAH